MIKWLLFSASQMTSNSALFITKTILYIEIHGREEVVRWLPYFLKFRLQQNKNDVHDFMEKVEKWIRDTKEHFWQFVAY